MKNLEDLKVKIWADGADKKGMVELNQKSFINGFTTNPTLMKKAGLTDYEGFAKDVLQSITKKTICFEVFSDEFDEMERQALRIQSWGRNVYVKIPITNTRGESAIPLIKKLSTQGVKLNITAMLTVEQIKSAFDVIQPGIPSIVSIFSGRIADTGIDPAESVKEVLQFLKFKPEVELLWASCRELLNVFQADEAGCHIITVTHDILAKFPLIGMDLKQLSLDTVKMFHRDARAAGFKL